MSNWTRREFVKTSAVGVAALSSAKLGWPSPPSARVSLVHAGDGGREAAIRKAIDLVGAPDVAGKWVALKPNFNSAHDFPGSTHNDTLSALVRLLRELGASRLTVADRSGMGDAGRVMRRKGVLDMASDLGFETLPLVNLPPDQWSHMTHPDLHWQQGFYLGRVFHDVDAIVQTCCLKTHRYGGHFTMSLKNSVGMVAKSVPGIAHDFMEELHGSSFQRHMIAELNLAYTPALVVMDAMECFTSRGPEAGPTAAPNVVLASTDRVALDAVGVAILREKGTTRQVSQGTVFGLAQIARAAELGIGVDSPERIEIVTDDTRSSRYGDQLQGILEAT